MVDAEAGLLEGFFAFEAAAGAAAGAAGVADVVASRGVVGRGVVGRGVVVAAAGAFRGVAADFTAIFPRGAAAAGVAVAAPDGVALLDDCSGMRCILGTAGALMGFL